MTKKDLQNGARKFMNPVVSLLASLGVPPMLVSMFGVAFSLYGAIVLADGSLFMGGVFLIISGLCDVLDGDLARRNNRTSTFGAFIDSTLDRVSEFAYFGAIIIYIVNRPGGFTNYEITIVMVALAGSVLTSYARARAEGVGLECKVGIMERPERIVLLLVGLFLGYRVLMIVMFILAVTSMFTFLQRVFHVYRVTRSGVPSTSTRAGDDVASSDTPPKTSP